MEDFALEIKTRVASANLPLENVTGAHYCQCQSQLQCANRNFNILMSYVPASDGIVEKASYHFIEKDCVWWDVTNLLLSSIFYGKPIDQWVFKEDDKLASIGETNLNKVPNFDSLESYRSWTKNLANLCKLVSFSNSFNSA